MEGRINMMNPGEDTFVDVFIPPFNAFLLIAT
ncbi:MAG: hypothetical protein ACI9AB_001735, partial [Urechidicola sp.]